MKRGLLETDARTVGNEIPEPEVGVVAENNGGDAPTPGVTFHACLVSRLRGRGNMLVHIIHRRGPVRPRRVYRSAPSASAHRRCPANDDVRLEPGFRMCVW